MTSQLLCPCSSTVHSCWQASRDFFQTTMSLTSGWINSIKQKVDSSTGWCSKTQKKRWTPWWVLQSVTKSCLVSHWVCLHVSTNSFWLVLASWVWMYHWLGDQRGRAIRKQPTGRSWRGRGRPGRCSAVLYTSPVRPPLPASAAPHLEGKSAHR